MGELADRLERLTVRETSPDGQIAATRDRNQVTLRFHEGAYRSYTESALAGQLGDLARSVRAGCQRGYYEVIGDVTGQPVSAGEVERELDGRERRFYEAQRALRVETSSVNGWITVETEGLDQWRVRIRDGALRALSEEQFISEGVAALGRLLTAYHDRDRELRDEFFDLKLPEGSKLPDENGLPGGTEPAAGSEEGGRDGRFWY
ncbi:hypothetical protein [Actinoplanes sp. NPDC051411]|uniref:hypothetical protein n=1 Tax=Actinoplanes sp. NPDC051411 TaxID=3155522 RepID=UPI003426041A